MITGNAPGHSSNIADINSCRNGCAHSSEAKSVDITDAAIVDLSSSCINSIDTLKAAVVKGTVIVNFIAEDGATDLVIITGVAEDGKAYATITVGAAENGSVTVDKIVGVMARWLALPLHPMQAIVWTRFW